MRLQHLSIQCDGTETSIFDKRLFLAATMHVPINGLCILLSSALCLIICDSLFLTVGVVYHPGKESS